MGLTPRPCLCMMYLDYGGRKMAQNYTIELVKTSRTRPCLRSACPAWSCQSCHCPACRCLGKRPCQRGSQSCLRFGNWQLKGWQLEGWCWAVGSFGVGGSAVVSAAAACGMQAGDNGGPLIVHDLCV